VEFIMPIYALATARLNADLFAAHADAAPSHNVASTKIDDCGTVVPHKIPGFPPPPPPPFSELAHFAGAALQAPSRIADEWCGTVPHRFPFPPPPPAPWIDGINQSLESR
jgi:hypothetical protein